MAPCPRVYLHILNYDVLVRHQAINSIVPSLPPVVGGTLVQQQGGTLLEGQLAGGAAHVVKLGDGFNGLTVWGWRGKTIPSHFQYGKGMADGAHVLLLYAVVLREKWLINAGERLVERNSWYWGRESLSHQGNESPPEWEMAEVCRSIHGPASYNKM